MSKYFCLHLWAQSLPEYCAKHLYFFWSLLVHFCQTPLGTAFLCLCIGAISVNSDSQFQQQIHIAWHCPKEINPLESHTSVVKLSSVSDIGTSGASDPGSMLSLGRVRNRGYQWPHKMGLVTTKTFFKK